MGRVEVHVFARLVVKARDVHNGALKEPSSRNIIGDALHGKRARTYRTRKTLVD